MVISLYLYLPCIEQPKDGAIFPVTLNGNYNCLIKVIKTNNEGGTLRLNANNNIENAESLSGNSDFTFPSKGQNISVTLKPISFGNWSLLVADNNL